MTNPDYTHLALVVDRSGSMASIKTDMEGGIRTLLTEQAALPGELHIDVTTFDTQIERPYVNCVADDVKGELIIPRGGTALYDAVGDTVVRLGERLAELDEDDRPGKVIILVVTDGRENSSHEYNAETVKALVTKQRDEFQWEFIFLGTAEADAFTAGDNMGFARGSTMTFAGERSAETMNVASAYLGDYRSGKTREFTEDDRATAEGKSA